MALISESLYTELGTSMATLSRTVLRRLVSTPPHTPSTSISTTQSSQPLPPYTPRTEYDDPPPRYVPPPPYTQRQGWRFKLSRLKSSGRVSDTPPTSHITTRTYGSYSPRPGRVYGDACVWVVGVC
ncbi:uncharacterized protein SPPG_06038 [Spizellomyces punctatus DAOM BR117]|uniref:Uncharacterized protein n=1 Tax=Spizellomyces punctatus (strain DAOM BR117) TaxID=645134 RepID=A0A0L0HDR1_SPIPD|nr:uncharacterized protein SPPG_06038 [Spizellomyces punctatus DAOM BR117]KNC99094.1 hypothetical protein SPPG_06038 [Spizellomyces punctatus DAOM BR117]|eukprot:XP_016607134.1 hypothetical protein SPPG_06038 [Spizellomyces punctatus DAOM BR117]